MPEKPTCSATATKASNSRTACAVVFLIFYFCAWPLYPADAPARRTAGVLEPLSTFYFRDPSLRGDEPTGLEFIEGYSEIIEAVSLDPLKEFSGESVWRFRADKPNAETFGVTTPGSFLSPLYLYNRTSMRIERGSGERWTADWVLLRRDETGSGASEQSVVWGRRNLWLRHGTLGFSKGGVDVLAGDFLAGWGQGLVAAVYPGTSYRPFLWPSHQARIVPNRSSYENTGFRGLAVQAAQGPWRWLAALAQTPLHGRVSEDGRLAEDYSSLAGSFWGEFGNQSSLNRRNTLKEEAAIFRAERLSAPVFIGLGAVVTRVDREISPEPDLDVPALDHRWDQAFHGRRSALFGIDAEWKMSDEHALVGEMAGSFWSGHKAPAVIIGWRRRDRGQQQTAGIFHFSSDYVSRLADGVRLGDARPGNRQGAFAATLTRFSHHELGGHVYAERNLRSEFSGSSLSHAPIDSRWTLRLRGDDRVSFGRGRFVYLRFDAEREPYLVDAKKDPRVAALFERSWRLETGWDRLRWAVAAGADHRRMSVTQFPAERAEGWDVYCRAKLRPKGGPVVYAKILYFDAGEALLGSRHVYLSSPELYWRRLTLASIAYQSLFASWARRGWRSAVALEETFGENISLWVKWGQTTLSGSETASIPRLTDDRDDVLGLSRWDFKTELAVHW
ncbi:MAG: hypothetical protein HYT79_07610 [Elusimicrobia bacterium]|nr:hypothetical protein [Elusimicrobiota bacterium]